MKAINNRPFGFAIRTFFFLLLVSTAGAQNVMTSSPYSMFGLGEIANGLYGQNAAMGGVAYGMRNATLLNIENPAGLVGIDSLRLLAEVSAFIRREDYKSQSNSSNAFTGNFSAFTLGGRIMRRWYAAASITPYSSVGYYFKSTEPLEGTPNTTVSSVYQGDGGLSRATLSNALLLPGNISLGVNLSYVFGNLTQTETQDAMSIKQNMYAQAFYADFGLQYQRRIGKETLLTLGGVYGYKHKLTIDNTQTITTNSTSTETTKMNANQYLPQFMGAGLSLQHKRLTYALDYAMRQYSALTSGDSRIIFRDAHELRAGISYLPSSQPSASFWKRVSYKAGLGGSTSYMKMSGKNGLEWRATAGFGFPTQVGLISTAFYYDRLQMQGSYMTRNIIGFTVSFTLSERLYRVRL